MSAAAPIREYPRVPEGYERRVRIFREKRPIGDSKMDKPFAEQFAADWIDSWNSHDLERVLSHYADDFEMSSPVITQLVGEPSGMLRGKVAVRAYWRKALEIIPDLHFELISVLAGVTSMTLYYKGTHDRLAAEVFHFGADRRVTKAFAHYDVATGF
jgi:SnoaL-like domain